MDRSEVVCSCLGITYGDIEDAVKSGAKTFEEVQEKTEVGTVCGACVDSVTEMIQEMVD